MAQPHFFKHEFPLESPATKCNDTAPCVHHLNDIEFRKPTPFEDWPHAEIRLLAKRERAHYLLIQRDPRDVIVSEYFYFGCDQPMGARRKLE